ncbi:hypothetical protein J690_0611 [Acinetobacter sp. 742879]|nr:hypothetical protein J690_0611 [Acinetobacter sp. 742879]
MPDVLDFPQSGGNPEYCLHLLTFPRLTISVDCSDFEELHP